MPLSKRNDLIPEFKSIYQQKHYYAQLQLEMACTGTRKAHFYQWNRHVDSVEMVFLITHGLTMHCLSYALFMNCIYQI